jgi:predicted CoA-binding protein
VTIDEFLAQRHLAFVGVSRDSKRFANAVYRSLRGGGRSLYPVNAAAEGPLVDGACPLMFIEPVGGVHRIHRLLAGRRIAA